MSVAVLSEVMKLGRESLGSCLIISSCVCLDFAFEFISDLIKNASLNNLQNFDFFTLSELICNLLSIQTLKLRPVYLEL